jgi:hypothetical protein
MIREETSIVGYEKSCAKGVNLQRWSGSLGFERHHSLVVHQRFTGGIAGDTD